MRGPRPNKTTTDIEADTMTYKCPAFTADVKTAGLVVCAGVPAILTSRADTVAAHLFSAVAAGLYSHAPARDRRSCNRKSRSRR